MPEEVGGVDPVLDGIGRKRSAGLIRAGGTPVSVGGLLEARPVGGLAVDFVVGPDRAQLSEIVRRVRMDDCGRASASTLDDAVAALNPTERRKGQDDHPSSSVGARGQRPALLLVVQRQIRARPGDSCRGTSSDWSATWCASRVATAKLPPDSDRQMAGRHDQACIPRALPETEAVRAGQMDDARDAREAGPM
ncbi:hypothetical protein ACIRH0_41300 [Streptomyces sp. NPDC093675]|uniref:hypothetical protein n=1 Tax=Streptomyces sp. NPDC093675 TaxID=3366049 RepID=UPI00382F338C